jgi:DNA-3-methyladenine glycosylase II
LPTRKNNITFIDTENGLFSRVIRLRNKAFPVTIGFEEGLEPKLVLDMPDSLTSMEQENMVNIVRFMLSTDFNLTEFYILFKDDPQVSQLIKQFYGLPFVLEPNLFEAMLKLIIYQQLNVSFAGMLTDRLISLGGEQVKMGDKELFAFPSPQIVASFSYDQLKHLSFNQRKAEYVIDFARAITDGKIELDKLWNMSDAEVLEKLLAVRGLGRWTIECFLIFGLGRLDVLPAGDVALRNVIKKVWRLPRQPTEGEVRELGYNWSPWRSHVSYYLWNYKAFLKREGV